MSEALKSSQVTLYQFDQTTGNYTDHGQAGCCIIGSPGCPGIYRIGCYIGDNYMCTADITSNNDTGIQASLLGNGYISFRDDQNRLWSLLFASDEEAQEFAAVIAVSMYGAAKQPEGSIVCLDVAQGNRDKEIYHNDKVKVRFQSWVLIRPENEHINAKVPHLGSRLEGNLQTEKPYMFSAPANHNSVTNSMKGFEGMVVGMAEEGRRFIVVPRNAKRGSGPTIHSVHMIYVVKKKDADGSSEARDGNNNDSFSRAPSTMTNNNMGRGGSEAPSMASPQGRLSMAKGEDGALTLQGGQGTTVVIGSSAFGLPPGPPPVNPEQHQAPKTDQPVGPPPQVMPPAPPPGFNVDQMETINRMRDQLSHLMVNLKDAMSKVDIFNHDFRTHETKVKPRSLATAQMEHSLHAIIDETEREKEELVKRDETLQQLEDKNKDLQRKVDKFTLTANQLAEDKKLALANASDQRLEGDQKVLGMQAELTRILSEREDTAKHLTTVKRLLEICDQDMKKEKNALQTAEVTYQATENKLSSVEENLQEEMGRRKLLETKIAALGTDMRSSQEEVRNKDAQMDERRRKMEADKLHYTQVLEEERNQAAQELRDMRQELVQELAVRDARYQEERARVARESFDRGRTQGLEDGQSEEELESDAKIQTLILESQRHRAELESTKIRLRQVQEQAQTDSRRLESQISALSRVVDDLNSHCNKAETEIHALEIEKTNVEQTVVSNIQEAIGKLSRPIGQRDLLTLLHHLRMRSQPSYEFENDRRETEEGRLDQERAEVAEWVRRRMQPEANQFEEPPTMRTVWYEERALPSTTDLSIATQQQQQEEKPDLALQQLQHLQQQQQQQQGDQPAAVAVNPFLQDAATRQAEEEKYLAEIERRQKDLIESLHKTNPDLELRPKTPPRIPTPPPPKPPTPEPEPAKVAVEEEQQQQQRADNDSSDDEDEKPTPTSSSSANNKTKKTGALPAPPKRGQRAMDTSSSEDDAADQKPAAQTKTKTHDDDATSDEENDHKQQHQQQQPSTSAQREDQEEEEDEEGTRNKAPHHTEKANDSDAEEEAESHQRPSSAPPTRQDEEEAEEEEQQEEEARRQERLKKEEKRKPATNNTNKPTFGGNNSSDEEEEAAVAPPPKASATTASRHTKLFEATDSDDDEDDVVKKPAATSSSSPASKPAAKTTAAPPKRSAPSASLFGADSSDDDSSDGGFGKKKPAAKKTVVGKKTAAVTAAAPTGKKSLFADSDTDSDDTDGGFGFKPKPAAKAAAAKPAAKGKATVAKKAAATSLFGGDSDESDW